MTGDSVVTKFATQAGFAIYGDSELRESERESVQASDPLVASDLYPRCGVIYTGRLTCRVGIQSEEVLNALHMEFDCAFFAAQAALREGYGDLARGTAVGLPALDQTACDVGAAAFLRAPSVKEVKQLEQIEPHLVKLASMCASAGRRDLHEFLGSSCSELLEACFAEILWLAVSIREAFRAWYHKTLGLDAA